jgi:hypothetical protein
MPLTVELSEVFLIAHVQVEGLPVPPETFGVTVALFPKTEVDPGYESEIEG